MRFNRIFEEELKWNKNFSIKPIEHINFNNPIIISPPKRQKLLFDKGYDQNVLVKVSYNGSTYHSKDYIKQNTADHIKYILREEAAKDIKAFGNNAYTTLKTLLDAYDSRKIFKFIFSPEDSTLANEYFIRKCMIGLENTLGFKIVWNAVIHTNTDKRHVHVIINREIGSKDISRVNPLYFNPKFIQTAFRENIVQKIATNQKGKVSKDEYIEKYADLVAKKGLSKIDFDIARNYKGKYVESWKYKFMQMRLKFLKSTYPSIFTIDETFKDNWQSFLLNKNKIKAYKTDFKDEVLVMDEIQDTSIQGIKGRVIEANIVDEINEKIGLIIRSEDKRLHLVELKMTFEEYKSALNQNIEIEFKSVGKSKTYRTAVINKGKKI